MVVKCVKDTPKFKAGCYYFVHESKIWSANMTEPCRFVVLEAANGIYVGEGDFNDQFEVVEVPNKDAYAEVNDYILHRLMLNMTVYPTITNDRRTLNYTLMGLKYDDQGMPSLDKTDYRTMPEAMAELIRMARNATMKKIRGDFRNISLLWLNRNAQRRTSE